MQFSKNRNSSQFFSPKYVELVLLTGTRLGDKHCLVSLIRLFWDLKTPYGPNPLWH